jgi:hypothetical protein
MITITKGQSVPENEGYEVYSPTGEYNESDYILVNKIGEEEPTMQFEAKFIHFGGEAYKYKEE